MILLSLRSAAGNTRGPTYVESWLRSLHGNRLVKSGVTLLIRTVQGQTELAIECPDQLRSTVKSQLLDAYPGCSVESVQPTSSPDKHKWSLSLRVSPDVFSIRTITDFHERESRELADPLTGLLSAIRAGRSGRIQCQTRLHLRPAKPSRVQSALKISTNSKRSFRSEWLRKLYLDWACHPNWMKRCLARIVLHVGSRQREQDRQNETEKVLQPLFTCWLEVEVTAPAGAAQIAKKKLNEIAAAFGQFKSEEVKFVVGRIRSRATRTQRRGFLLSPAEIATLWHLPTEAVDSVSRLHRSEFRELEPPVWLPSSHRNHDVTILGKVLYRNQRDQFGITMDNLRRHLITIGKTGCGKSTCLLNVVRQQIESGRGVVLFDPHGQLADEVLDVIPKHRTNDVIVFDASDRVAPVGFNPLVGPDGIDPPLVADGVLTSFKNVFGLSDGTAPRLLHIFRNCLLSLIGSPQASLSNVQRILVDANFRKSVVAAVSNDAVQDFWMTEFNRWNDRDRTQYIASLQNKLGAFTTNQQLQRILNPAKKGIQLREVMDSSKILICNLSKGTVGHDASTLLGSLLLSSLQIAAMSRADIPEADRTDCVVVIDEFHSYLSDGNSTMADALAESRKYRTSYVLSTQMLEQLDHQTLSGILGNCGSTLCMTVGPRDAEILTELLGYGLTPEDLMKIPKYHAYLRMLLNGAPKTFSMTTIPAPRIRPNRSSLIREISRRRYGH